MATNHKISISRENEQEWRKPEARRAGRLATQEDDGNQIPRGRRTQLAPPPSKTRGPKAKSSTRGVAARGRCRGSIEGESGGCGCGLAKGT
eukprot:scaffold238678_cov28-Tisochrysis_lutea.AAC.1